MTEQPDLTTAPADSPAPEPEPIDKPRRLSRRPAKTQGIYMVLAAVAHGGAFVEVGWYRAHSHEHARRQVVTDAEVGHLPDIKEALDGDGVWLRPVPAESWGRLEHPSGYKTTRKLVV